MSAINSCSETLNQAFTRLFNEAFKRINFEKPYFDKFHSLTAEERENIICKIKTKYESDDYLHRETVICKRKPNMSLYQILYDYAEAYGVKISDEIGNPFPHAVYCIDDKFIVRKTDDGQSIDYNVLTINEYHRFYNEAEIKKGSIKIKDLIQSLQKLNDEDKELEAWVSYNKSRDGNYTSIHLSKIVGRYVIPIYLY